MYPEILLMSSPYLSECLALIDDLGLVIQGSVEDQVFQAAMAASRYSRYHFCDRWKDRMKELVADRERLKNELYKRNCKGSRYLHSCLSYQTKIDF